MSAGIASPLCSGYASILSNSARGKDCSQKKTGEGGLNQTTPIVMDMKSDMDIDDVHVDKTVKLDYASDQPLCRHPRLQEPQALTLQPSANQVAQATSHPRGNT